MLQRVFIDQTLNVFVQVFIVCFVQISQAATMRRVISTDD